MPWRRGSNLVENGQRCGDDHARQRRRPSRRLPDTDGSVQAATSVASSERRRQRAAEVVDHLPTGDAGDGTAAALTGGVARHAENPGQELPVATSPAVLTRCRDQVVRRELIEQLDVGHETGTGEDPFEQIMAQQRVLGHTVLHGRVECIDVVDPLAREAPLLEEVLVDVGDGGRVWIDPGGPGEDPLEDRSALFGRKRRRDPWLQDAVALGHPARDIVEVRLVERMSDRAHQSSDGASREFAYRRRV